MRRSIALLVLLMLTVALAGAQPARTFTAGGVTYTVDKYVTANYPVKLAFAPDGRLFYTEKNTGSVRVVSADGVLQPGAGHHAAGRRAGRARHVGHRA